MLRNSLHCKIHLFVDFFLPILTSVLQVGGTTWGAVSEAGCRPHARTCVTGGGRLTAHHTLTASLMPLNSSSASNKDTVINQFLTHFVFFILISNLLKKLNFGLIFTDCV